MSEAITVLFVGFGWVAALFGGVGLWDYLDRRREQKRTRAMWFEIEGLKARRGRERGKLLG